MAASKRTKRERLRAILETPYVRLPLILIAILVAGLAVVYVFVFIVLIYFLATSIGNPNAQLVVGMISALGTATSAAVAYLLYRNSARGPEITVAVEDPLEIEVHPLSRNVDGDFYEQMILSFPLLFSNSGPRGGAVADVRMEMMKPAQKILWIKDGVFATDRIEVVWSAGEFSWKAQPIKDNETVAVLASIDLRLKGEDSKTKPPAFSFKEIQEREPHFQFKVSYKVTAGKGKILRREKVLNIRPKFPP